MSSNRLRAKLLAVALAVFLWPAAAEATVATAISSTAATNGSSSISVTTTGAVPVGGTLWVGGLYTGLPATPTVSGCTLVNRSLVQNVSTGRYVGSWSCVAASGIAAGTVISQTQAGSTQWMVQAFSLPTSVSTYDQSGGSNANSATMAFGPFTPANSNTYSISVLFTITNAVYTEDAAWTYLTDIFDSAVSNTDVLFQEKLITGTSPVSSSVTISPSGNWIATYDAWAYTTGGATCTGRMMLMGAGKC